MPRSEALKAAQKRYRMNKRKDYTISFSKDEALKIEAFCEEIGLSVNGLLREAVFTFMAHSLQEDTETEHDSID